MTDQHEPQPENQRGDATPTASAATEPGGHDERPNQRPPLGDTVGTGTSIALGCVIGTVAIVIIGLLFLVLLMLFA